MKKMLLVIFCMILLSLPGYLGAQASATSTAAQALSPDDAAKAKVELKALADAFGVSAEKTVPATKNETHKTVGDAADKALDLVNSAVASVSATLEKIAPHVWEIMIRQQYARAIGGLIVPWGMILLILLYLKIIRANWKTEGIEVSSDEWWARFWFVKFIPGAIGLIVAIWGFNRLSDSIMYLVNPEYYAVRDIITMLLGQTGT